MREFELPGGAIVLYGAGFDGYLRLHVRRVVSA